MTSLKSSKKLSTRAAAWIGTLTVVIILSAAALVSQLYVSGRLDLTRGQQFTLSKAAENTLESLPDIVTVRVVMSRDLPSQFQQLRTQAIDLLREFEARGDGKFNLVFIDPGQDSTKRKTALSLGIQEVQLQEQSREGMQVRRGFFGVALLYGDKKEVFPVVQNLETFEYDLIVRLMKLTGKPRVIGTVNGSEGNEFMFSIPGQQPLRGFEEVFRSVRTRMGDLYTVVPQYPGWLPIEPRVDLLLVAAPTRLTPEEKYRIDQFVMTGKPVIFLTPGMNVIVNEGISGSPAFNDYEDLLNHYGIRVRRNVVLEPRQWEVVRFGNAMFPTPYPYWIIANYNTLNPDNPITAGLQTMSFPWTSSIDVDSAVQPGTRIEPLVFTTAEAWEESGNLFMAPRELAEYMPGEQKMHALAVLRTGPMTTAYPVPPPSIGAPEAATALKVSRAPTRILVVSNALFASDFYLGYTNADGNQHFLLNALDYLALDPSLIDVRSRQLDEAPLDEEFLSRAKTPLILFNMLLAPLLLIVLGVWSGIRRRNREMRGEVGGGGEGRS